MAVEDIKQVQEVMAREGKQLVYTHYNLVVCCDSDADLQKPTNHLAVSYTHLIVNFITDLIYFPIIGSLCPLL